MNDDGYGGTEESQQPPRKKRKRGETTSASRGNESFRTSRDQPKTIEVKKQQTAATDLEIMTWISSLCGQCCGMVPENSSCCLLQQFQRHDGEFEFQVCILIISMSFAILYF